MRKPLEALETLEVANRTEWRRWLRKNYRTASEIWLVFYKKGSGKSRVAYNDAVEEALCFGWIDSIIRRLDDQRFAQRFSPRKPKSSYSPANKERLRELIAQGKVAKSVLAALPDLGPEPKSFSIAPDILAAIKSNQDAWRNFRKLTPSYKRIRIGFIEGARKRPAEFQKRLRYFIKMTAQNKQFGFGGIEKYY